MIVGIGTDLVEIERVVRACQKEYFLKKYFTQAEIALFEKDKKKSAGNFAVKESVVKMFGTGFREVTPIEIECLRDEFGKPYVNLYGKALELGKALGIQAVHVSISNTKKYATAFVVGES